MIARFCWVSWSPPTLTSEEERSIAQAVHSFGVGSFVSRFAGLSSRELPSGGFHARTFLGIHAPGLIYIALILCGFMFLDMNAPPPQKGSSGGVLVMLCAVGWLGVIIFYASMVFVSCRYAAWL